MKTTLALIVVLILKNGAVHAQYNFKTLSSAQMRGDLQILESAWSNLHPGLYRYNTPQQITSLFARARATCSAPQNERTFYLMLSQLVQQIKCGHTYLNPLNLDDAIQDRLLPKARLPLFFEIVEENKMVITHNVSAEKNMNRGDEIISINKVPVKTIIDSLLTVSRSDGMNALGKKLNNMNETPEEANAQSLFDIYFPLFFPGRIDSFLITVKKLNSHSTPSYSVAALTTSERVLAYETAFGSLPLGEKTWEYKLLNAGTAYMKFGTFSFWNSKFNASRFVDSVFIDVVSKPGVKNIVIDIRNNEGGDNTGDYILSYITTKKIGCEDPDRRCYRYLTIPDSLLPHLTTWDNSFKKPKDPSMFFVNDIGLYELKNEGGSCDVIEPRPNGFRGNVFLLTNAKNSSAGYEMARNFKTAKLGKIVGETTGGSQQGINGGEIFFLTLPNSRFEVDLPLIYNYHANKPDTGIAPDYEIKTTQKAIKKSKDAQLDYVLKLIRKGK